MQQSKAPLILGFVLSLVLTALASGARAGEAEKPSTTPGNPFSRESYPSLTDPSRPHAAPPSGTSAKKPVSVSYGAVLRCFPELEDERQAFRVDLRLLKQKIDEKHITSHTQLLSRVVVYKTPTGQRKRLRLENQRVGPAKINTSVQVEALSESGAATPSEEPGLAKQNPSPTQISAIVTKNQVENDETLYIDTKLNGSRLTHRKNLTRLLEVVLEDKDSARQLRCEDRKDFGAICTCTRK